MVPASGVVVDGPLVAPCCFRLPPDMDPAQVYQWCHAEAGPVLSGTFPLSSRSVLYEMALHGVQRPWHRRATEGSGVVLLMRHFAELLRPFEHHSLLAECCQLLLNHLEAGLGCVWFRHALERLLPASDGPHSADPDAVAPAASRCSSLLSSEGPADSCVAVEVDEEKWVFCDVEDEQLSQRSRASPGGRLRLGGDATLAYSVTLFIWAAVRLLVRRLELLREHPADPAVFAWTAAAAVVPQVSALSDSFEALCLQREELARRGLALVSQQDWRGAAEQFTKALDLSLAGDEGQYALYQHRAGCHLHLRQPHRAVEDCTAALHHNPHAYAARYLRAQAYEALGLVESATDDVAQLLHLYPGSRQAQELQARLSGGGHFGEPEPEPRPGAPLHVNFPGSSPSPAAASPVPRSLGSPRTPCGASATPRASPLTPAPASDASLTFERIDLAALPPFPEPPCTEDTTALAAFLNTGAKLEYDICAGRELGRGSSGRVYKAVHPSGGWFMAVKEMGPKFVEESPELLNALELMGTMKHNNIVRGLGMRRLPGVYHMVLQYCSGGTLRRLVEDLGGLSPRLMRKYATEVLLGLRYVHGHGLVHQDLKAGNIYLLEDGRAKIGDFGTCIRTSEAEARRSGIKGTVPWMAPETFCGRYSPASDVWAFGCTLIEMATAKDPFHEQQFREQLTAMVFIATRPDAVPPVPTPLSDDLGSHFFHSCVARDPSDRPTADLLLRHPWLRGPDPTHAPASREATPQPAAHRPVLHHPLSTGQPHRPQEPRNRSPPKGAADAPRGDWI